MTTAVHDIALAANDRAPGRRLGFLWGGIGALVPSILTFTLVDHDVVARYVAGFAEGRTTYDAIGYAVRILVLFVLGGFWAFLHKGEREPMKLVQLGMLAPAMITGMINAANLSEERNPGVESAFSLALIAPAWAQERPDAPPSPIDEFVRGLLGRP